MALKDRNKKTQVVPSTPKKYHLHMINLGRKKLKYLFPNKVVHACFSRLTVSYDKYSHVLEYISEKYQNIRKMSNLIFFFNLHSAVVYLNELFISKMF